MTKICFLCPHTKISGGVKVIFTLAHYLARSEGFEVTVGPRKFNDKVLAWFTYDINFKIEEFNFEVEHDFSEFDIVINYLDGVTNIKHGIQTKHILFLQGFGSQRVARETKNLQHPFDAVIATSAWLADMAKSLGHSNVAIVAPGIDRHFTRVHISKPHIPVIGCLYHRSPQKNFSLFEATVQHIFFKLHKNVRPLILSAKLPERLLTLTESAIPSTIIIDPPQLLLPYIYSSCTAWVAPSVNEGFGLTPLEAMACGCPTILYPNLGLAGILLHKHNCIIAKTKQEIGQEFLALVNNTTQKKNIIKCGLETAARFTWERSSALFRETLMGMCLCKGKRK